MVKMNQNESKCIIKSFIHRTRISKMNKMNDSIIYVSILLIYITYSSLLAQKLTYLCSIPEKSFIIHPLLILRVNIDVYALMLFDLHSSNHASNLKITL